MSTNNNISTTNILQYRNSDSQLQDDWICTEEPLEFRLPFLTATGDIEYKTLAITMRTPGQDFELARGFLYSEGIINSAEDISSFQYCKDRGEAGQRNSLEIQLTKPVPINSQSLDRRFTTYSSCGLCGKTSIQSLELQNPPTMDDQAGLIEPGLLKQLSATMLKQQPMFQQTGSAHASGLFDLSGNLVGLFEDIGRHNALDKLIGHFLQENPEQMKQSVLLVSGRASFELVQKTIMAGIPMLVSAGAPSSLAVVTAKRFNLTLIGFLRSSGFNVYHAPWRLKE